MGRAAGLKAEFEAILHGESAAEEVAENVTEDAVGSAGAGWHVTFIPAEDLLQTGNEPFRMFRELQEIVGAGNLEVVPDLSRLPELTSLTPEQCYISWDLYVRTDVDKAAIEGVADDCEIAIHPLAGDTAAPAQAAAEYTDEDAAAQTAEVTPLPVPEKVAAAVNTAAVAGAA